MPPKKAPKLTKKQLEEQRKQAARLEKQREQEEAEAERARLKQQARVREIQMKKMLEEERVRIIGEKQKKYPEIQARIKSQKESMKKLTEEEKWVKFITPYEKNYDIEGTNLSTFVSIFKNSLFSNTKTAIQLCDDCEIYIRNLQEKILQCRANYDEKGQNQYKEIITVLHEQVLKKMQEIMIYYSNTAEEMEQKNVEEAKKKNQNNNSVQKAIKPIDSVFEMSGNYKIGMYINTPSTKNYNKFNPLSIKQFGFNTQVPPKWTNNTAVVKFQWLNFNSYNQDPADQFRIVGGVFNLQFYDMFVGTKRTNNISIKKHYKGREILQKFKLPSSAIKQPFKIMYEIPSYIFLAPYNKNNIKIAQYDVSNGKWNVLPNDCILEYIQNEKRVTCKVSKPEPVAFVENKCADYPYVAWELRTVEQGKILLDIQLRRSISNGENAEPLPIILQFEIGPNVMKLQMNKEYKEFADLCENYYPPEKLLFALAKRGINILPVDEDYRFSGVSVKDRDAEKNAIRDIAYGVESFTVRSQPNSTSQIRVKIRQNLDYQFVFLEDQEKDWKKICWQEKDKCSVTNIPDLNLRHMNLQTLLEQHDFCERQCFDRMKYDKQFLLRKTVMKVLELTRILAFTTADEEVKSSLIQHLRQKLVVE